VPEEFTIQQYLQALSQLEGIRANTGASALAQAYGLTLTPRTVEEGEAEYFMVRHAVFGVLISQDNIVLRTNVQLSPTRFTLMRTASSFPVDETKLRLQGVEVDNRQPYKVYGNTLNTYNNNVLLTHARIGIELVPVTLQPTLVGDPAAMFIVTADGAVVRTLHRRVQVDGASATFVHSSKESRTLGVEGLAYSVGRAPANMPAFAVVNSGEGIAERLPPLHELLGEGLTALARATTLIRNERDTGKVAQHIHSLTSRLHLQWSELRYHIDGVRFGPPLATVLPRGKGISRQNIIAEYIPVGRSMFVPAVFQPVRLQSGAHYGYSIPPDIQVMLRKESYIPIQLWVDVETGEKCMLAAGRFGSPTSHLDGIKYLPQYHGNCMGNITSTSLKLSRRAVNSGVMNIVQALVARMVDAYSRINVGSPGVHHPSGLPPLADVRAWVEKKENIDATTRTI